MEKQTNKLRKLRSTIIIVSIIGLLSFFSLTITTFAYGIGDTTTLYLILYPTFLISTILIIAKVKFGYFLTLFTTFTYSIIMLSEVGKYLIFNLENYVLFWVLLIPYLTSLTLIPLTIIYLTTNFKYAKEFKLISIAIAFGIFIFAIAERYDKDYSDNIFIDAEINAEGQVKLNCKPGFADTRTFVVTTNIKGISAQIKKYGKSYQGSYFLNNTTFKKNFRFSKLKTITLTKIENNKIFPQLTWTVNEMKGDLTFLEP